MYEKTDKTISYLNRKFIRLFENAKGRLLQMDEINRLSICKEVYAEADKITRKKLGELAEYYFAVGLAGYKAKNQGKVISERVLDRPDPVTEYTYTNEVTRKRERFFESLLATPDLTVKCVDTALRYWSKMVNQYCINVTDEALLDGAVKSGVKKFRWKTQRDDRVCQICLERDNRIYDADSLPDKAHWGCRCYLIPIRA